MFFDPVGMQAPAGSFGSAIYVPTPEGFSNAPGCVESYAATARFRLYTKGDKVEGDGLTRPLVLREEVEFKASETDTPWVGVHVGQLLGHFLLGVPLSMSQSGQLLSSVVVQYFGLLLWNVVSY